MKIGFIGLGRMGSPIAANLIKAGHSVTVWNRGKAPVEALVAQGAMAADAPEGALRGDALFSMLANDLVMQDLGLDGPLLDKAAKGLIHVNLATTSVALARQMDETHKERGLFYVSAPVFGGPGQAADAELVVVAGGEASALKAVQPAFDAIAARTVVVGEDAAKANLFKVCGNFLIASQLEAMGEAFALLRKGGVDPARFREVMGERLFTGAVFKGYGAKVLAQQYEPASFALTLGLKDVNLVRAAASDLVAEMPSADLLKAHFEQAIQWGWQDRDWSAISEVPAKKAGL